MDRFSRLASHARLPWPGRGPARPALLAPPVLLALLTVFLTRPAVAQVVRGRVLDDSTGVPIADATVILEDSAGANVGGVFTGVDGTFGIAAPDTGVYRLRADRLGYTAVRTKPFTVGGDTVGVLLRLATGAVPLAPLTVVVPRGRSKRGRDRFARREALGKGTFITPEQIAAMDLRETTDVLKDVPGVWLSHERFATTPKSRAWGCMKVIVNEVRFRNFNGRGLNGEVLPGDLEGVEIYEDPSQVPPELLQWIPLTVDPKKNHCGLIVVWTKGAW